MSEIKSIESETQTTVAGAAPCSADWSRAALELLKALEWSASVNTETVQVSACPCCYGWNPNGPDAFWRGRELRRGHKRECVLELLMLNPPNESSSSEQDDMLTFIREQVEIWNNAGDSGFPLYEHGKRILSRYQSPNDGPIQNALPESSCSALLERVMAELMARRGAADRTAWEKKRAGNQVEAVGWECRAAGLAEAIAVVQVFTEATRSKEKLTNRTVENLKP